MSLFASPPTFNAVVDSKGKATNPFVIFFNQLVNGDSGQSWTPQFTGLTTTGSFNVLGIYYVLSNSLVYFRIIITPTSGTIASTAGTTFVNNFPFTVLAPATFGVVAGNGSGGLGTTSAANNGLYLPTIAASSGTFVFAGLVEAQ